MKTNYNAGQSFSRYLLLGFLAILATACGSYQNSSYYDNDGIYGGTDRSATSDSSTAPESTQSLQYKNYFSSLNQEAEIFTDVDNYSTYSDTTQHAQRESAAGYSGWGDDYDNVTVNVYGNNWGYNYWNSYWHTPYWGWSSWYAPGWHWGLGWSSWYGPGWGWGWNSYYAPYYWNNYYYGNGWYGHGHHNVYNRGGRRGTSYNSGLRSFSSTRQATGTRSYTTEARQSSYTGPRSNVRSANSTPTRSNNSYTPSRNNNVRQSSSTPSRSYSPSSSSGGGRSSGFGGGSRSGGGRR